MKSKKIVIETQITTQQNSPTDKERPITKIFLIFWIELCRCWAQISGVTSQKRQCFLALPFSAFHPKYFLQMPKSATQFHSLSLRTMKFPSKHKLKLESEKNYARRHANSSCGIQLDTSSFYVYKNLDADAKSFSQNRDARSWLVNLHS